MLITQPQFSDVPFQSNIQMGQKNNLQNNNLFKVFEEPEEPIPEEEIPVQQSQRPPEPITRTPDTSLDGF